MIVFFYFPTVYTVKSSARAKKTIGNLLTVFFLYFAICHRIVTKSALQLLKAAYFLHSVKICVKYFFFTLSGMPPSAAQTTQGKMPGLGISQREKCLTLRSSH